jgi:tRNA pseudouridine55 synthase
VDKPSGRSSFSVVAEVRRRTGGAKTGHAGTLDPLATGVLVLALGRATRVVERLVATEKRYETTVDLGAFTDTDDAEGARREVDVAAPPDEATVRAALERFTGTFPQKPPAFSAVKVEGRRAYRLARAGAPPDIPPRRRSRAGTVRYPG